MTRQMNLSKDDLFTQLGSNLLEGWQPYRANQAAKAKSNPSRNGTPRNDRLIGTVAANILNGLGGNDRLLGNGGNDILNGGAGADTLNGGPGRDRLNGGTGNDVLTGGPGADWLEGGAGRDELAGGGGSDRVSGGTGNDLISGGLGRDTLAGGTGDDTYVVGNASVELPGAIATPDDTLIEGPDAGVDTVISFSNYRLGNNLEKLVLIGSATTGEGNNFDNTLTGNDLDDQLYGGNGNDVLVGGNGNDVLNGAGFIAPTFPITGTGELDLLSGGAGSDTFVVGTLYNSGDLTSSGTQDLAVITDFTLNQDRIQLNQNNTYSLGSVPGLVGTGIFLQRTGAPSELLALVQDVTTGLNLNDTNQFVFV